MASIIDILGNRCEENERYKHKNLTPVTADRVLFNNEISGIKTEVRALSPSNTSFNNALSDFSNLMPCLGEIRRVLPRPTKNNNAIVLWIKFGTNNILLGSDLEESTDPSTGWSAILDSPTLPNGKAKIFKVPHHGSKTSHSEDIWNTMVDENNVSLLTCKTGGKSSLPTDKDIDRLKGYTEKLYCTSEPAANQQQKKSKGIELLRKQ